jgi:hypothetical protein
VRRSEANRLMNDAIPEGNSAFASFARHENEANVRRII